ncbi:MAG TPA: M48 family metallopeptidase [Thermoleophilaceae bacterium]|nr:M48 family metallopeptidase [Thermoleophilaceae bacterium]
MAIIVAVVAAGTATLILRPRGGSLEPTAVLTEAYFSPAQLERARDFRGPQRLLGLGGIALSGASLALIALRPPRRVRRLLQQAARRPMRGAALTGAGISVTLVGVGLPLAAWRHERAVDAGLSTQSLGAWLGDVAKSTAIEAALAALGAVVALALIRRYPRHWWIPAAGGVVGFAALTLYLSPVLIDPIFNKFEPLPKGKLHSDVLRLAEQADVEVGEVLRVDASRRTTGINAYVGGLGHTKRVVLYDNLIEGFPQDQVRSVVAHELGHVKGRDLPRGLLWIAIVAPAGTLLMQRLAERFARQAPLGATRRPGGGERAGPAVIPAVALAVALVSFGLGCAGNVLSRQVEARADAFALELTREPEAFIALERSLALRNISQPDPPKLWHLIFGTHPTTIERIGVGETYARRD